MVNYHYYGENRVITPAIPIYDKDDAYLGNTPKIIYASDTAWADVLRLRNLVEDSDTIFLLNDTRESRWIPTVMARAPAKTLINAALCLDWCLIMQHGISVCVYDHMGG